MSTGTSSMLSCILSVCQAAREANAVATDAIADIEAAAVAAQALEARLNASAAALACILTSGTGTTCNLPDGGSLPSLADALDDLNATTIGAVAAESFTATAAQTVFTLSAAPASAAYLDVCVNGAHCLNPTDYTLSDDTITFTAGLSAGDVVDARRFSLS